MAACGTMPREACTAVSTKSCMELRHGVPLQPPARSADVLSADVLCLPSLRQLNEKLRRGEIEAATALAAAPELRTGSSSVARPTMSALQQSLRELSGTQ